MTFLFRLALWFCCLPLVAWGSRLTSVQSSYHAEGNFAILVLRFDGPFTHQIQETDDGQSVLLKLTQCQATPETPNRLSAINNALVDQAQLEAEPEALTVKLRFRAPMKLKVSHTQNPYSLILDIAPLKKSPSPPERKATTSGGKSSTKKTSAPQEKPPPQESHRAPKTYSEWLTEGKTHLSQKQEREALNAFQQAAQQAPDSAEAHYWLGLLSRKWGQPEAAIEHFQKAKTDSVFLIQATTELASLYHQLGRTTEEVAEWESFFAALRRTNPELEAIQDDSLPTPEPDVELVVGQNLESTTTPDQPASATPSGIPWGGLLLVIIVVLFSCIVLLYLKQRELNRTIMTLLQQDEAEMPARKRDRQYSMSTETPPLPPPATEEPLARVDKQTAETAREVLGLYRAGMSIQAIAERLKMGQDEVRLILNLVKEETSAT